MSKKGKQDKKDGHELYVYRAVVKRVYHEDDNSAIYDADTIHVLIDHGFKVFTERTIRLARINAPELRGKEREAGLVARDVVREMILNKEVILHTQKDTTGSYARYLAEVFIGGIKLNDYLLDNGYAKLYVEK